MLENTKISKWENDDDLNRIIEYFTEYMCQDKPLFFSRIGGTDFCVTGEYYNNNDLINKPEWYNDRINVIKKYNGYFDFNNDVSQFHEYLKVMVNAYKNSDGIFNAGVNFIDYKVIMEHICDGKTLIPYGFVESVRPFQKSFQTFGQGKKILIISPLSKSIEHQFKNKDNLYVDYKFPEFELLTYNTKITYNTYLDNKNSLNITTNNWNEECLRMSEEIKKIDFDIAFLSCASYSMYLGNFIKHQMGKKAIYIGGVLNVFFNIYGGRFKTYFGPSGLNPDFEINPFENTDIKTIQGGRGTPNESLEAYFGERIK